MTLDDRVSRLEGIIEAINHRLDSIDSRLNSMESRIEARLNTQLALTVAMWVTTMLAVLSTLAAVLLKG